MNVNINLLLRLMEVLQKNQSIFIASTLGLNYLSEYDKFLLKINGVDIEKISNMNDIDRMFYFGFYSQMFGNRKSFKVKKSEFEKWFQKEIKKPISTQRKAALEFLKNRTFTDITGLGNKISNNLQNRILISSKKEKNLIRKKIKSATIKAFKENKSQQELASILRDLTKEWSRDFSRIADYVLQESYAYGRLANIIETYGEDVKVYKETFPGVCVHCEKNYGSPGQEPIIYTIDELLKNGDNIGRKEQLPVLGQAHPWARSILHPVPPNSKWDNNKRQFVITRDNRGIKRNAKVKINIS